jgi:gluconokinase
MGASVSRSDAGSPLALAIDIGTSATRAAIFDGRARPVSGTAARVAHALAVNASGAATLDPDTVVAGVVTCIDAALRRLGRRADEIAVVGTSAFWHSLVGVDRRGRPTTELFMWADLRARDSAAALAAKLDPDDFHARTGCYLHSSYSAVKLHWLRDTQRRAVFRTARWVSFPEYLSLRFSGAAAASHAIASATGLYDHGTASWDPEILAAIGIGPGTLSPISDEPITDLRPAFARRWPALARAQWLPGIGDGALANVGSGCAVAGRAAISLGTSGAVRACYRARRASAPHGLWEYRLDQEYVVVGGAVSNGGNAIQWASRIFRRGTSAERDHGLTVLPLLSGERTPWWDDRATGAIAGLRADTRPGDVAGALVESVALRLAAATRALLEARTDIERLVASGGMFAAQPKLAQVIADAAGRPVALAADAESSTRGAAIVALARIGALPSIEVSARTTRTYRPNAARHAHYASALARQDRLMAALRSAGLSD